MKKVLIVYYSQTGQVKSIIDSLVSGFTNTDRIQFDYFRIKPEQDFPFPWPSDDFFDSMPESVKGIPVPVDMSDFPIYTHYDLVVLAGQVWYLSPSIPLMSFLLSNEALDFFKGKNVITLYGVRNMWLMAHNRVSSALKAMNATLVGNIVLVDRAGNSVSVLTIIRWLLKGKKGPSRFLPEAGVSGKEIAESSKFAKPVELALLSNDFSLMQHQLIQLGGVPIQFHVMSIEKTAIKIFRRFADFILKKGIAGEKRRLRRVRFFKYYLLIVIFLLFPFAALVFRLKKLFFPSKAKEQINEAINV